MQRARRILNPWIGNFAEVEPGVLYRGAQPEIPWGIDYLAGHPSYAPTLPKPIDTVIDLQGAQTTQERVACNLVGITFESDPLPGLEIFTRPPERKIELIMRTLAEPMLYPIFVHCLHGSDRTGCIVALWRITHGWTVAEALDEMKAFGNSWIEIGYRREVEDFL